MRQAGADGKGCQTLYVTGSTTVKPTVELTKKQEAELQVMELRMLRLAMAVRRMDRYRNEYIKEIAGVE